MATTQAVSPAAVRGPQSRMPSGTGPIPTDTHSPRNSPRPTPSARMAPEEAAAWERKRRAEEEARYAVSPQSRHIPLRGAPPPASAGQGTPTAPYQGPAPRSSCRVSPHTQLPSFNNLTSQQQQQQQQQQSHDAESAKRRRAVMEGEMEAGGYSYADEEEEAYRARERARRAQPPQPQQQQQQQQQQSGSNGRYSPPGGARPGYVVAPPPGTASEQRAHEESYDGSLPLSRRRGDAAHAKASRLHIDVGAGSPTGDQLSAGSRRGPGTGPLARSAPPHQITFDDAGPVPAQHPAYHPAGIPPPPAHAQAYRYEERYVVGPAGSPPQRLAALRPSEAPGSRSLGPPPLASARFVPQTATLPSPAYHTTAFMRGGAGMPPGPPILGPSGPPRTAGLVQPPHTARLPDHLRSPPSSKAQFLSLFSNFYDSLSDSRTLKATLEDQVRRSNTLLQTLQRSSRVLDATVDRRIREERVVWEGRVFGLEGRVRELEAKLGLPTTLPVSAREGEQRTASHSPHAPLAFSAAEERRGAPSLSSGAPQNRESASEAAASGGGGASSSAKAKNNSKATPEDDSMESAEDRDELASSADVQGAP